MNQTLSIAEFLTQTGAEARFFDMGRRVVEIPADTMHAFEHAQAPYPQPFQRHAWLGIVFQHDHSEHHIWFVKLPLDEQGLLQQAARDDFLRRIAETLTSDDKLTQQAALDDNPHGFSPREDRMAAFHAKVSCQLGLEASQFFAHAVDYFCGLPGFEQWNFVGLQGIADVVLRRHETHHGKSLQQALIEAIPQLPETPFAALCTCLENEVIDSALGQAVAARLDSAIQQHQAGLAAAIIRGLSQCEDRQILHDALQATLDSDSGNHVEVLAATAGRAWEALQDEALRFQLLENLAHCAAGQQAFNSILTDLLFMPGLRTPLLQDFHNVRGSDRLGSETLRSAIEEFLHVSKASKDNT